MLNYDDYTKMNRLTKSVTCELRPVGNTRKFLEEADFIGIDRTLKEKAEAIKPVIDEWILQLMEKGLQHIAYDFSGDIDRSALESAINNAMNAALPSDMKSTKEIISGKFIYDILSDYAKSGKSSFPMEETLSAIDAVRGSLPIMERFLISRTTAVTTWLIDRVVDNYKIYRSNMPRIEALIEAGIDQKFPAIRDFRLESYYGMLLTQSAISGYNREIKGSLTEDGDLIQGVNGYVSELNQQNRANKEYHGSFYRLLDPLHKQILAPDEKQVTVSRIETEEELAQDFLAASQFAMGSADSIPALLADVKPELILVHGKHLHNLSHHIFGDDRIIPNYAKEAAEEEIRQYYAGGKLTARKEQEMMRRIANAGEIVRKKIYRFSELCDLTTGKLSWEKYVTAVKVALQNANTKTKDATKMLQDPKCTVKGDNENILRLKQAYEAIVELKNVANLISFGKNSMGINYDVVFYNSYESICRDLSIMGKSMNRAQAYITRKPSDMNGNTQTCLGSKARFSGCWYNGEKPRLTQDEYAFARKDGHYYLLLPAPGGKSVPFKDGTGFEILEYKKIDKAAMNLPRLLFNKKTKDFFIENPGAAYYDRTEKMTEPLRITREEYELYTKKLYIKDALKRGVSETELRENLTRMIWLFQQFLRSYEQFERFDLSVMKRPEDYDTFAAFTGDLDTALSSMQWNEVDAAALDEAVEAGNLYMFELHTRNLYSDKPNKSKYDRVILAIFSDENARTQEMKLNGSPTFMYRPPILDNVPEHRKGSIMVNRRTADGEPIPPEIYLGIYRDANNYPIDNYAEVKEYLATHNVKKKKAFYTIKGNKRYTRENFTLTFSYVGNNDVPEQKDIFKISKAISGKMDGSEYWMSIARDAKNLLYYVVIDADTNIIDERSLNVINGFNYMEKLRQLGAERKREQQEWRNETTVAEIKEAYCDAAITEILSAARKYNAMICLERISAKYKDRMSAIDNQVYERFENRLQERLSDFNLRTTNSGPGSILNPYQLADPGVKTWKNGTLRYVSSWMVRNIDPETGFVPAFNTSALHSVQAKRQFLAKFRRIEFMENSIEFDFDYNDFVTIANPKKTDWTVVVKGRYSEFDKRNHKLVTKNNVVKDVIYPVFKDHNCSTAGNLAERVVDIKFHGACVEILLSTFLTTCQGIIRTGRNEPNIYRSPITGKQEDASRMAAVMLAKKAMLEEHEDSEERNGLYSVWFENRLGKDS